MKKARDSQREKLYRAEIEGLKDFRGREFETIGEVEAYYRDLLRQVWFGRTFGRTVRAVKVYDGRGRRSACHRGTINGCAMICLPRWSRFEAVVLHELAHALVPSADCFAPHGREFAEKFLRLVRNRLGPDAECSLKAAFKKHHVKYKPKKIMTAESLAALRERGRLLAAARKKDQ